MLEMILQLFGGRGSGSGGKGGGGGKSAKNGPKKVENNVAKAPAKEKKPSNKQPPKEKKQKTEQPKKEQKAVERTLVVQDDSGNIQTMRYEDKPGEKEFAKELREQGYNVLYVWDKNASDKEVNMFLMMNKRRNK